MMTASVKYVNNAIARAKHVTVRQNKTVYHVKY